MKEPKVHVGILFEPQIEFILLNPYRINGMEISGKQVVTYNEGRILWNGRLYDELLFEPVNEATDAFELLDVTIGINFHWERKEDQRFLGSLKIIVENKKLTGINVINVEDYLTSVISSEMSATASLELLKAHAVISRSWLLAIDNSIDNSLRHDSAAPNNAANCQLSTANSPLSMMHFQEYLEYLCWQQGNMKQTAPAQRMVDFTKKKLSYDLPETSYAPGLVSSPLHFWMPSFIAERLSKGFQLFGKYSRGLLTNEATMIGVETRTSAPVRITRDKETLQHVRIKGLFPCGEGAGYAGGIVSAGIDGERCAEAAKAFLG